ncbi:gephyrin-like molybdotransferase Glp [Thiomonas sp.]|jgi:molybdopterin molybdotransferase|uniref:molybdopterin molybdotransferase MoeA n=1 Tax=Thiomonas sp. TaxID=2047785 RepID=UPI002613F94F|nr:gephyrin-like molybdotransferase Glp [Thiomonas sp.]
MSQDLSAGMLDVDTALARLLEQAAPLNPPQALPTEQGLGRVLAQDVGSPIDVPGLDNSQMDGYALRSADVPAPGTRLRVAQRIAAGQMGVPLAPGQAARIFTGAPMPPGADAVVMQEQCRAEDGEVLVDHVPRAGEWVRPRGFDVRAGSVVLGRGQRLRPQDLGQIASVGVAQVSVAPRPRVALLCTGDELAQPGQPLRPGGVYNSNRFMLRAMLEALGCEVSDLGQVADTLQATREALGAAARAHDLVLSSGGMSVGGEDHVRPAVESQGRLAHWSIAMKPGKPLAFGELRREDGSAAHFIGLPGNPVSSFVTFALFVRPFVLALQGASRLQPPALLLPSASDWPRADRRREFLRARLDEQGRVELYPQQNSAVLSSAVWGDGLVDNPGGQAFAVGDTVRFLPFSSLLT